MSRTTNPDRAPRKRPRKTKQVCVKTVKLADKVSQAKGFKTGEHRYETEIWGKGLKYGTVTGKGRTAHAGHNGLHTVLRPDGLLSSWVDQAPSSAPQPADTGRPAPSAPATTATPDATAPAPSHPPSAAGDAA